MDHPLKDRNVKQLIIACIGLATLIPVNADENKFSISLGEKVMASKVTFETSPNESVSPYAHATGIFTNISYYQTPSISYAFEYATFPSARPGKLVKFTMGTATTEEAFSSNVKPKQYLSWQGQYTFRPTKTVRPIVLAGLTYLKADVTDEYTLESNGRLMINASGTTSDSTLGLVYGFGLDINFYTDVSFVLDYRIRPDIADNSADEINGSLKYQF